VNEPGPTVANQIQAILHLEKILIEAVEIQNIFDLCACADSSVRPLVCYRVLYMRFWGHQIEVQKVDCIDLC
jgi:hypothetical protein